MKHAVRAVIAIALGAGLAAAAQAQSTNPPSNPAPGNQVQSTAPQKKQRHAKAKMHSKGKMNIRQAQLRLKSEGLLRGKLTGKMDRQTRVALAREQQNGLARSGSSMQRIRTAQLGKQQHMTRTAHLGKKQQQIRTAHLGKQQQLRMAHMKRAPKAETTGVGSSMPTKNANAPQTNPAPAGAGGTTPSNAPATSTPPSGTPSNK